MKLAMFQMENAGSVQNNLEKSLNAMKSAAHRVLSAVSGKRCFCV